MAIELHIKSCTFLKERTSGHKEFLARDYGLEQEIQDIFSTTILDVLFVIVTSMNASINSQKKVVFMKEVLSFNQEV
jgi:hypothetical protein